VREILLRVAYLADELPHLAELDLNPVIALPPGAGAVAVDARIRVVRPALAASRR
jgi:acyl-CoA synthetase (NDP forming)